MEGNGGMSCLCLYKTLATLSQSYNLASFFFFFSFLVIPFFFFFFSFFFFSFLSFLFFSFLLSYYIDKSACFYQKKQTNKNTNKNKNLTPKTKQNKTIPLSKFSHRLFQKKKERNHQQSPPKDKSPFFLSQNFLESRPERKHPRMRDPTPTPHNTTTTTIHFFPFYFSLFFFFILLQDYPRHF